MKKASKMLARGEKDGRGIVARFRCHISFFGSSDSNDRYRIAHKLSSDDIGFIPQVDPAMPVKGQYAPTVCLCMF